MFANLKKSVQVTAMVGLGALSLSAAAGDRERDEDLADRQETRSIQASKTKVQLGPRPFYLVEGMDEGELKQRLQQCSDGPFYKTDFSIGHRGAAMQFPEHTQESYQAAARMGAGIIECDVTFTGDRELVCRHSQCDLHSTTNILETELAANCSQPFTPAQIDPVTGETLVPASAKCCTSDITLAQFKSLQGKMDASNPNATTVAEYLNATPKVSRCSNNWGSSSRRN